MKLPLSLIKNYTDIDATNETFAARMTMTGTMVEGFSKEFPELSNIVTGVVENIVKHQDSDKLWICTVDVAKPQKLTIVTGAQNLKQGDIVPVALDGATIIEGKKIVTGELRGVKSEGMLCSLGELGLTERDYPNCVEDGIMVLDKDTEIGIDAIKLLGLDETIIDFDITSNRPDCLCATGIAREVAASFEKKFTLPEPVVKKTVGDINTMLKVTNDTPDTCLRYTGAVVKNVRVGPSPEWLRRWIRQIGMRPVNNIVDITNFVMYEYNQPMHAFDLKNIKDGHIIVRKAKDGEILETLDGVKRTLTSDMTVIADPEKSIGIAGIMGGEYSGTYDDTTEVIIESAMFDGPSTRKSSKMLGLRTDASGHFEKGLDPESTVPAVMRALQLVEMLDAGDVVGGLVDIKGDITPMPTINLDVERINALLGTDISKEFMIKTLENLEFKVSNDQKTVVPPSFRADVEGVADLSEEIARIYGYDVIPSTVMDGIAAARPTERQRFDRKLTSTAIACGLYEINTYSFMSPKMLDLLFVPQNSILRKAVVISNPFGEDTSLMRTTALPAMLEGLARNKNARTTNCGIFEMATEYIANDDADSLPNEPKNFIIGGYGDIDFFKLKGIVDTLFGCAYIYDMEYIPLKDCPYYHPGRSAYIVVGGEKVATIGEIHPDVIKNFDAAPHSVIAQIDVAKLFELRNPENKYKHLPKFPATTRDLALVCDIDTPSAEIEKIVKSVCGEYLETIKLFDIYTGEGIGENKRSLAYNLVLRDKTKTLTDVEVDGMVACCLEKLKAIDVVLRS